MIENLDFEDLSIYISATPVNLNKSIDGLAVLVQEALGRTPVINELFVFYNKSRDKIKLLIWDGMGFIILYKRFEEGCDLPPFYRTTWLNKLVFINSNSSGIL